MGLFALGSTWHAHLAFTSICLILHVLQSWFKINGPPVQLPKNVTDITTAATIIQLAVPDLKLVLDPLLYLKAAPKPKGIPKVIHMTMKSKHSLAPHVLLSIISWGWYNRGYALLLYDNRDINAYMREFYPGFVPSKQGDNRAQGL